MQIKSLISLLALCSITVFSPVFGQTSSAPITVTTDKATYSDGSTITISGTVAEQLSIPISVIIKDSTNNLVYVAQTSPTSGNTYSVQVVAGGDIWKTAGTYEIDVTYGGPDKTAKTTFMFTATAQAAPASTTSTANQTSPNQAVPEFGPLSMPIFAISILAVVIAYARIRMSFKF
ncbi:MAG: hypothetical protein WBV92_04060 [Nitrosotalea sp.]